MSADILVVAEQRDGVLNKSTLEAIVAGQSLASEMGKNVNLVVMGHRIGGLVDEVAARKVVANVISVDEERLGDYTPDAYSAALKQVIASEEPAYVLFSHTYMVRDYAPKLAAALQKPLVSDCVRYKIEAGKPVFVRQVFQGKVDADFTIEGDGPYLVSFQVGAFNAENLTSGAAGSVRKASVSMDGVEIRTKVLEIFEGVKQEVDLSKAERIVSVGRGIKKEENIDLVKRLAEALDADLAASRPVCDDAWLPLDRQIGSSGQTVAPKLYFAVGISGAIQHIVGMKNSGTIVAINKDPHAPIFDIADYGVVGDLFEVVPAVIEAIKARK